MDGWSCFVMGRSEIAVKSGLLDCNKPTANSRKLFQPVHPQNPILLDNASMPRSKGIR